MNEVFSKKFTTTYNLFDKYDILKLTGMLDLSQEISSDHAAILGCGYDDLIKEDLIWVVVRTYVEIYKPIKYNEYITLKTYPLKPRFIEYNRDVVFYDENDEVVAIIKSIWMILNLKNFEIETPKLYENIDFSAVRPILDFRVKKLPVIDKNLLKFEKEVEVTYSMLDHNGHMNNTRYVDFFYDIYRPKGLISKFQIEYIKQSFEGEKISLYSYVINEKHYLFGYNDNDLKFYLEAIMEG